MVCSGDVGEEEDACPLDMFNAECSPERNTKYSQNVTCVCKNILSCDMCL